MREHTVGVGMGTRGRWAAGLVAAWGLAAGCDVDAAGAPGPGPRVAIEAPGAPVAAPRPAVDPAIPEIGVVVKPAPHGRRRTEAPTVRVLPPEPAPAPLPPCTDALGDWTCGDDARCVEEAGAWSCRCEAGFEGDGRTCRDVDECATGAAGCAEEAACVNLPGGYDCRCPEGFEGDGWTCEPVDPCEAEPCAPGAACLPQGEAVACVCPEGTTGDGVTFCAAVRPPEVRIGNGSGAVASPRVALRLQEPGNLLANGGAEDGALSDWILLEGDPAGLSAVGGGFLGDWRLVAGQGWTRRGQLVDLWAAGYPPEVLDEGPPIAVREWAIGTWPLLGDPRWARVELRDVTGAAVAVWEDGSPDAPVVTGASWSAREGTLTDYGPGVRFAWFEHGARAAEGFPGAHGAALDAASVVVGAVEMRLSNDGVTWTGWEPFAPRVDWELVPGQGPRTVFVQFRDAWGTVHEASASATLAP